MDSLVDEEQVTSSEDRRESENSNDGIISCRKNLDRVSTPVTSLSNVRDANRLVFTSVSSSPSPSPSSGTTVKHGSISTQAIALSQPGGGVSIVQLQLPNQTNVVQSVIQQTHQQSVIQAAGGAATVQTVQIPKNVIFQLNKVAPNSVIQSPETTDMNQVLISTYDRHEASNITSDSVITPPLPTTPLSSSSMPGSTTVIPVSSAEDESKKRREVLERRPSYRKILNELSSADIGSIASLPSIKSEDETDSESSPATIVAGGLPSPYIKVVPASTIQLANASQDGTVQGIQTLTMTNAGNGGNTILQYTTQGQDGQFFVPVTVSAADLQAYQIRTTGTGSTPGLTQGVVMTAPTTIATSHNSEDAAKKRELRLIKNREAAKECRRKKKEYIKCLEQRVSVLENQNKALIEELKTLKNLYCQKE